MIMKLDNERIPHGFKNMPNIPSRFNFFLDNGPAVFTDFPKGESMV